MVPTKLKQARKLRQEGRNREAVSVLIPLLGKRLTPVALAETRLLAADCFIDLGQPSKAVEILAPLVGKTQGDLECARASRMGLALLRQGHAAAACDEFDKAIAQAAKRPEQSGLIVNSAAALLAMGRVQPAIDRLKTWLESDLSSRAPAMVKAEALNLLGNGLRVTGQFDAAIEILEEARALYHNTAAPPSLYGNLSLAYYEIGETAAALEAVQTARKHVAAQGLPSGRFAWLEAVSHIAAIPGSQTLAEASKQNWTKALTALESEIEATLSTGTPDTRAQLISGVCTAMPFFLGYLGGVERNLHARHGQAVHRVMQSASPHGQAGGSSTTGAARIGLVTTYLRPHSVWKIPLHGWLAALSDTRQNEIAGCLHVLNAPEPQMVERVRHYGWDVEVHSNGPLNAAAAIHQRNHSLLLYPEIGMDAQTWQIAALRLAPHQAYGLGHPVTTGLPTLDTVLSSDLMESDTAADHYTERLERIPDLGCPYLEAAPQPSAKGRAEFGLNPDRPTLLSCQTVFKYQPQDDSLYAKLAKALPDAQIVFLTHASSRVMTRFKARLSACFEAHGLVMEAHCCFLPQCSAQDFAALNACSDVFLDAPGWSGFNSSLEATRLGLPVVTLPSETCRTRHALAVMRFFRLEEGIASSQEDYVEKVSALVASPKSSEYRAAAMQAAEQRLKTAAAADGAAGQALRHWCLETAQ